MKRIKLLALLMACFIGNAFADDTVSGLIVGPASSTTWTMHVVLNNEVSYNAFQMDITLPEGFSVTADTDPIPSSTRLVQGDDVTIGGTTTATPFVVDCNTVSETSTSKTIRVLGYNLGNNAIQGITGNTILKLKLTSDAAHTATYATDDPKATFSNVKFVKTKDLTGVELGSSDATLALRGDVNYDKTVDTADAVKVVNYFLGSDSTVDVKVADMDDDDVADTADAVSIVNTFLGTNSSSNVKGTTIENFNVAE